MGVSHSIWSSVEMVKAYSVACYSSDQKVIDQKAETGVKWKQWKQVGTGTFKGHLLAASFLHEPGTKCLNT